MRAGVLIAAILLGFLGLVFTSSIIGAIIGVPMLFFGFIMFLYGLAAKEPRTVITQPHGSRLTWKCKCGRTITEAVSPGEVVECSVCGERYDENKILAAQATRTSPSARTPSEMFCRDCGAKIPRDSKFCKECGSKQS